MTRLVIYTLIGSLLGLSTTAHAADGKKVSGGLLILGGATSMALAFDYHAQCPNGYSTHQFQGLKTQCVYIGNNFSDVIDQPTNVNYKRPKMMYGGIAGVGIGVVLLAMPARVQRHAPSVTLTPAGWQASKTVRF